MTSMMPLVVEKARVRRRGKVLVGPVSFTLEATGVTIGRSVGRVAIVRRAQNKPLCFKPR